MDNDVKHTAELYRLVAWAHARRKQITWITVAVVTIAAIVGIYFWHQNYNETVAAESLSRLKAPAAAEAMLPGAADPYIKLANDFSGTSAAARALLIAGGILFDAGKYQDAQKQFERMISEYTDFPLADQAALGIAACLEAQGKVTEAASRYDDFIKRHAGDSALPEAKSALARLYVAQNQPDKAFQLYAELARAGANSQDSWSAEAGIQAEELLQKYPALRQALAAAAPRPQAAPGPTLTIPAPTNAKPTTKPAAPPTLTIPGATNPKPATTPTPPPPLNIPPK